VRKTDRNFCWKIILKNTAVATRRSSIRLASRSLEMARCSTSMASAWSLRRTGNFFVATLAKFSADRTEVVGWYTLFSESELSTVVEE